MYRIFFSQLRQDGTRICVAAVVIKNMYGTVRCAALDRRHAVLQKFAAIVGENPERQSHEDQAPFKNAAVRRIQLRTPVFNVLPV